MKKLLIITAVALLSVACHKQPAQKQQQTQEPAQEQIADKSIYIDITGITPDGKELSLKEVLSETDYVLLDFWASWCGPCRRFIPVLKEIYASQPKGKLEILSCSVDQDEAAWRVALQEEQMPWLQMREDEAHPCSDKYNVEFIPHTVLFDREGHILGVNLEEPELEAILL